MAGVWSAAFVQGKMEGYAIGVITGGK